jgi:hypothetical protein
VTDLAELYAELKPQIAAVANPLFEMSEKLLREMGNFLPHGAVLTREGELRFVAADPGGENGRTTSTEVLPLLHAGLKFHAREHSAQAVGVAENVTVTPDGTRPTKAVKVLFEHESGLATALYLPFDRKLLRGFVFGRPFSVLASPEVRAWSGDAT